MLAVVSSGADAGSARPPDRTSSVVAVFASTPGWRYVTPVTSVRNRIVVVRPATYASAV
jgi:hypothetical protein